MLNDAVMEQRSMEQSLIHVLLINAVGHPSPRELRIH
jgi:hypothetical protein